MGFIKLSISVCLFVILYSYVTTLLGPKLPVNVDGYSHPAFKRVVDIFRCCFKTLQVINKTGDTMTFSKMPTWNSDDAALKVTSDKKNVESGKEPGAAFAVYHKGELVVDIWGGYADVEAQRPWARDTISLAFSTTKGVAAIVIATMVEKGLLDYTRPVAEYWPEFAQNDKGNITVEILLSHQGGLAAIDEPIHIRDIKDNPDKVERILAAQKTAWPAGSAIGYHAITYGFYVDTLIRKVDPKGRDTAEVFREDIADIFDIDLFMNTPKEQYHRAARVYQDPTWMFLMKAYMVPKYAKAFTRLILFPNSVFARAVQSAVEFAGGNVYVHNNPDLREVTLSSAYSTGTARAYAKLHGILGNGGTDGKQSLLSRSSIAKLGTPLASGVEILADMTMTTGRGVHFWENPKGQTVFGHPGHGGQVSSVDVDNHLGIAYLTNYITVYAQGDDPRYKDLEQVLYECLNDYLKD